MCWNPTCMTGKDHPNRPPKPGFGGHMFYDCVEPCNLPGSCPFCDGGLASCVVCKEAEGGLAKICPGPKSQK